MSVDAILIELRLMDNPASEDQKKALNDTIDAFGIRLDLNQKELSLKDIQNLCATLETNTKLKILGLGFLEGWSPRGDRPFNREPSYAIASLLEHNSTLEALNLAGNRLSDFGAFNIFEGLKKNATSALERLNLMSNEIPINVLFTTGLEGTKLKKVDLLANALSNENSLVGIESLLLYAHNLEEINLGLDTNLDLKAQAIADIIAKKRLRPIRPTTFFGKTTAEHPAIQQAFIDHAQFIKEMEERAKELGQTIAKFLPNSLANIVNDYAGLPKAQFEAVLKKSDPLQKNSAPESVSPPTPPQPIEPSAESTNSISPKTKDIITTGVLVVGIAALITLNAFLAPIIAIILGAITVASIVGVVGYNVLQDRRLKPTIQPESASSDSMNPPPAVLPKVESNPEPRSSQTATQQQTNESVPENTTTGVKKTI
jgi:hypothetical protein